MEVPDLTLAKMTHKELEAWVVLGRSGAFKQGGRALCRTACYAF